MKTTGSRKADSGFACMECGKRFRTVSAAEKASSEGCPKCGGCDIDLAECQGHESIQGPAGISVYCDGSCRLPEAV